MNASGQDGLRSPVDVGWRVGAIVLGLCLSSVVQAALIGRTITVDGTLTDWTNPDNILTNPGQFSTDCDGTIAPGSGGCDLDYPVSSTGRDLKKFSFTWDANKLYLYVERYASTNNQTDWWFYIDTDTDGLMEANEPLVHVDWSGSNRKTNVEICPYTPSNAAGDPLTSGGTADGYTMQGTTNGTQCASQYSAFGGSTTGVEMEVELTWSSLGVAGVQNMGFHISSSNGTNIPSQIKDNMDGPGGNSLFPSDLYVSKTVSADPVNAAGVFTYTVELTNGSAIDDFTSVVVEDFLPADVQYISSIPHAGTTFTDSGDIDTIPDTWTVGTVNPGDVLTLSIEVQAANVTAAVTRTNTATIVSYTGTDSNTSNNASSVDVTINPAPQLTVNKTVSQATANPGETVRYTVLVTNVGHADAANVVLIDDLDRLTPFRLGTFSGQNFRLLPLASPMAVGTPTYEDHQGNLMTPVSGNNAPAGYDGDVGEIRIPLTGSLPGANTNFTLEYDVLVR